MNMSLLHRRNKVNPEKKLFLITYYVVCKEKQLQKGLFADFTWGSNKQSCAQEYGFF